MLKKTIVATVIVLCLGVIVCKDTNKKIKPYDFSWEPTNFPSSDCIWHIAVASNGDVWASSFSGTIYLSTDNGDNWFQKNNGPFGIASINVSPVNGHIFLANFYQGLFRSTDNGENWVQVTDSISIAYIYITPSGEIYITGYWTTVYYSNDNGDTWVDKGEGLPDESMVSAIRSLALGIDSTLYTGTSQNGVYRSTDGGDTWLPSSNYIQSVSINSLTVSDDSSIFAVTSHSGLLKSIDKGVTWSRINMGFSFDHIRGVIYNSITGDILITLSMGNNSIYYYELYRSTDLGASWELQNDGLPTDEVINMVAFNPNTGQMFASCYDGLIYRSKKN